MSIFSQFKFQKEKDFASALGAQLAKEISPELMQKNKKVMSVNKITRLLEKTYASVREYKQSNQMGFFKRTVFANAFQWDLKNRKYPEDFVTLATEGLVVELMKSEKASSEQQ